MTKVKQANIALIVFLTLSVSKAVWPAQEWDVHGCRIFLPDDAPQQTTSKAFGSMNETGDNAFIRELKEKGCYSKDKPIKFIGSTEKSGSPMAKYEGMVTLRCHEKYILGRIRKNSLELKERPVCPDCEHYFHISGEYLVERNVGAIEYSKTARIYKVDDLVVKASGTYPWYEDHADLVKSLSRNDRACYLACESRFVIEVNRSTLEVHTSTFDKNDKTIWMRSFSCKLSEKKI